MTTASKERLYSLLPALYRLRDREGGQALRALLAVIEKQLQAIEDDITGLYDNWFIETCEPWAIPYLAELIGVSRLPQQAGSAINQRALVANTLSYRRRKGTAGVLVQLARDLCGWPARVVEYAPLVAATQHLSQVRPANLGTIALRDLASVSRIGTAFDPVTRSVDLRSIAQHLGRHNRPNVGLFVWRLRALQVQGAPAARVRPGRYTFHPCGIEAPLFAPDRVSLTRGAQESEVPTALSPMRLSAEVAELRAGRAATPSFPAPPGEPVFTVRLDGAAVPPSRIDIAALDDQNPLWSGQGNPPLPARLLVDPQRGRLVVDRDHAAASVTVSYWYGAAGELGGGAYPIEDSGAEDEPEPIVVARSRAGQPGVFADLDSASTPIRQRLDRNAPLIIELDDDQAYAFPRAVELPPNSRITLRAGPGRRPILLGPELTLQGPPIPPAVITLRTGSRLTLRGLLIAGGTLVLNAEAGSELVISHCTLAPRQDPTAIPSLAPSGVASVGAAAGQTGPQDVGPATLRLLGSGSGYSVRILRSILGQVALRGQHGLALADSILHGTGDVSASALTADTVRLSRCTVFGATEVATLEDATDCLFLGYVRADRPTGCVRYSYLPDVGSTTPLRYRCQPDLALRGVDSAQEQARVRARLVPRFTSTQYGQPGAAQLTADTSEQVRRGGSDNGEPGALGFLALPQREATLEASVNEYLRTGFEAGIFFEN